MTVTVVLGLVVLVGASVQRVSGLGMALVALLGSVATLVRGVRML